MGSWWCNFRQKALGSRYLAIHDLLIEQENKPSVFCLLTARTIALAIFRAGHRSNYHNEELAKMLQIRPERLSCLIQI